MKKLLVKTLVMMSALLPACAVAEGFIPNMNEDRLQSGDWPSAYTHLPELMKMGVEPVKDAPVDRAATVELLAETSQAAVGKATYFRSRPIAIQGDQFAVEWDENILEDFAGPQIEIWGNVGKKPGEGENLLLRLSRTKTGLELGKDELFEVQPGWRHFKVVVSVAKNTFDVYYDKHMKPEATGVPLQGKIESSDRLGIGFVWYLSPGTSPTKWQVGGISVNSI